MKPLSICHQAHVVKTKVSHNTSSLASSAEQNVAGTGLSKVWPWRERDLQTLQTANTRGPYFPSHPLNLWVGKAMKLLGDANVGRWAESPPNSDLYQHKIHCPKHPHGPQFLLSYICTSPSYISLSLSLGLVDPKKVKTQIQRLHTC